ncbi:MAG: lysophospholipid acyltransferase family protein [Pseudobdellovibrio sp.]
MKILIYLRSLIATLIFPFTVLILGPIAIAVHLITKSKSFDYFIMLLWGKICCRMCGVKVVVEGMENIPPRGCLFLFNHTSFFDIFAMSGYIPGIKYGAKAELFKIPVFAQVMKIMGTLPIYRGDREKVIRIYKRAKSRFEHGERFALSPEGGRFYDKHKLSPFKAGPFLFAMSADAPVVPLVILGAYEALPKGGILFNTHAWSHTIQLKILKPIETSQYTEDTRKDLQRLVYDQMNSIWEKA